MLSESLFALKTGTPCSFVFFFFTKKSRYIFTKLKKLNIVSEIFEDYISQLCGIILKLILEEL